MPDIPPLKHRLPVRGLTPTEDCLLGMVANLSAELAVVRERLDTLERLSAAAGTLTLAAIGAYVPDAPAQKARDEMRQALIRRLYAPVESLIGSENAPHGLTS